MSSILGPYLLGQAGPFLPQLNRWNPRVDVVFQPNPEDVEALRIACPTTLHIGRIYQDDGEVQARIMADPQAAARWVDGLIRNHPAYGLLDYWYVENEVCPYWHQLEPYNQFICASIALADKYDYKRLSGNDSNGQPDMPVDDRMAFHRVMYPAFRKVRDGGHLWGKHQYAWPTLWQPDADWYIHRLEHEILGRLPDEFDTLRFVVGEYGLDRLIVNQKGGWQLAQTPEQYAADLINISTYTDHYFGDRVMGYCLYKLGSNGDAGWDSYDIEPILQTLADHFALNQSPVEPEPEPPVEVLPVDSAKVYDLDGTEHDEAWLACEWEGCKILRATAEPGEFVFRAVAVYVTTGNALFKGEARGTAGKPQTYQPVAFTWPSLSDPSSDLQDLTQGGLASLWAPRAVVQPTNSEGITGFGIGLNYGPLFHAWVVSPSTKSDCITNTGMRGGTNHTGPLHVVWQLVQEQEPVFDDPIEAVRNAAWKALGIPYNPSAAFPVKARDEGLGNPVTAEYDIAGYRAQGFAGGILYCLIGEWDNIQVLAW